jgi:hypothetical protein
MGLICANSPALKDNDNYDNLGFRTVCDKKPSLEEYRNFLLS